MKTTQNRGLTFFRTAGLLAVLVALLLPASASAVDSIYWSNEDGSNSIRYGPLSGDNGGSTPAQTLFNDGGRPCGVALNPAAGKAYWANWDSGEIRVGDLDGTGANTLFDDGIVNVCGVAVDPANNKIYWANFSTQEIRVGNLDGTGTALTLFTDPGGSDPSGVAIDPADNKIYWTNQHSDQVRVGNLDGTGSASTLFGGDATVPTMRTTRSALRSTQRPARSTGPTSSGARSGSGPWGAAAWASPRRCLPARLAGRRSTLRRTRFTGPAGRPARGSGSGTWTARGLPRPCLAARAIALHRTAAQAREHQAPDDLRRSQGRQGTHLPNGTLAPDLLGAFLYRAPASSTISGRRMGRPSPAVRRSRPPRPATTLAPWRPPTRPGRYVQTSAVKKVKAH